MQPAERSEIAKAVSAAVIEASSGWLIGSWYLDAVATSAYRTQLLVLGGAVLASTAVRRTLWLIERVADVRSGRWAQQQAEAAAQQDAAQKAKAGDPDGTELEAMTLRQLATAQEQADAEGRHSDRARIEARMTALIEASRTAAFEACELRRKRRKQESD